MATTTTPEMMMVDAPLQCCSTDGTSHSLNVTGLPDELLLYLSNAFLNPAERASLGTCNRRMRGLLPTPLRLKIVSSKGDGSLQPEFFVSKALKDPSRLKEDYQNFLLAHENLVFGQEYYFWTFDYERGNRVYFGRHTRHGHKPEGQDRLKYMYTMGLRPRVPNQAWEVLGGEAGDTVMWGEDLALSVGGSNPRPRQPDSTEKGLLSCLSSSHIASQTINNNQEKKLWRVLNDEWGEHETLQLIPCEMYVPGDDVQEGRLQVHAIPEVCDEGEYLLYSPQSQRDGSVTCEGYHVTVDFQYWVENGIMHFRSGSLPFTMGVPILQTDSRHSGANCLSNLLDIKSARWGCIIYYAAVAADVSEGKTLDMQRFLRRVTDHRDHTVEYNRERELVSIHVKNKSVLREAPSVKKDGSGTWKFILSW